MQQAQSNLQDFLTDGLFSSAPSELNETLKFLKDDAVTLTQDQVKAITLLRYKGGFDYIIDSVLALRKLSMPTQKYMKVVEQGFKAQAASSNPQMVSVMAQEKKK
ncbi:hypothetical protein [Brevibacillus daliensis]|uniref:hypothetical protein n=1 Tax=Brevibacillus daliensis TaxID=2892995 RepID=UPI001E4D1740|nr:hypothetical protein [Brevibacillus daliensis]